ncbi:MAG: CTP synthase [Candidatus Gracilibacteria bacterium]|nr:CTP synthase [Candidatus Gracilibacteria bacterium]
MSESTKYIIITGGVISGVGKGVTSASIGKILKGYGYKVTSVKIDPYINYDAGTMRPTEHGEVWVTSDGGEIDQDLGNYERFLEVSIPRTNNMTTGQVYKTVIDKERKGEYLGKTVQLIPHVTGEIQRRILEAGKGFDFCIVEVGGVVGDYENIPFLFAIKALEHKIGRENIINMLVSYLPVPNHTKEMKTKPTQQSIKALTESSGIIPDFIVCRSPYPMDEVRKSKIVTYANIPIEHVISAPDANTIYEIPLVLLEEKLGEKILKKFGMEKKEDYNKAELQKLVNNVINPEKETTIAIVCKYLKEGDNMMTDAYISVSESLIHAGANLNAKVNIKWVDAKDIENRGAKDILEGVDGILVPGGFGSSGIEGKIEAITYARENNIPFLGICLGMQLALVEYARNKCDMQGANSIEIDKKTPFPIINIIDSQKEILESGDMGGTMRLGTYGAILKESKTLDLYKNSESRYKRDYERMKEIKADVNEDYRLGIMSKDDNVVLERHRHRYEVNPKYIKDLEGCGMVFAGYHVRKDGTKLMEFIELPEHKFFHATQAHPEFKSNIHTPSPLFYNFVKAGLK